MCVEFVALAKIPVPGDSLPLDNGPGKYRRAGRGRVVKSSFEWLEACELLDLIVI
ncbi:hypothetical protein F4820DRAFT_440894 [Hypoxylon rubiginosum]|uniref:Uncharacterized protein n=1 Tax=Hypoxylon rubiginosum TaxID=110542 RepID=A0ACB9YIU6_9PEZI|nr:hypothetical protein F4820DRAFT_440894 [Hypoxylon rubiginosum]